MGKNIGREGGSINGDDMSPLSSLLSPRLSSAAELRLFSEFLARDCENSWIPKVHFQWFRAHDSRRPRGGARFSRKEMKKKKRRENGACQTFAPLLRAFGAELKFISHDNGDVLCD